MCKTEQKKCIKYSCMDYLLLTKKEPSRICYWLSNLFLFSNWKYLLKKIIIKLYCNKKREQ